MAQPGCAKCLGMGRAAFASSPCHCVNRAIFRQCMDYYREGLIAVTGAQRQEWRADFILLARRVLDAGDWLLFHDYMLDERPWQRCAQTLGLSRGLFFHRVYRIEAALGAALRDTRPYALWPIGRYLLCPPDLFSHWLRHEAARISLRAARSSAAAPRP